MDIRGRKFFVDRLVDWGSEHHRSFPWREERDPFKILVAEVLLQRSRGRTVAKVYSELFRTWGTADELSKASLPEIEAVIRPLGLIRRATTLKLLAHEVAARGSVPESVEELVKLPGVGPYAANATAIVAFGVPGSVVDSVSSRVYRRFFGLSATFDASVDELLWHLVKRVSTSGPVRELNWAALDLAATVCLPKVPRCSACPLQAKCEWRQSMSHTRARLPVTSEL